MTDPAQLAAPDKLGWWCQSCRETGALHCGEVEVCIETGHMKKLPYSERERRYKALRAKDTAP